MAAWLRSTRAVSERASTEAASGLDIEEPGTLISYLRHTGRVAPDAPIRCRSLRGGVSNRAVLVELQGRDLWVVKQALPKLRVAVDWYSSPERIHREALGLRWLAEITPPGTVPALAWEDERHHLLAMGAVPRPHANWKELLLRGEIHEEHLVAFGRLLATIHRRGWERRHEVEPAFSDRTFFESLRLEPYYRYTATRVPAAAPFLHALVSDTERCRLTLVHGDYSPKNVLVRDGHLVLLDHEVMHFGDPAFDLGFALAHLLSKARHLPGHQGALLSGAASFWEAYRQELGEVDWGTPLQPRAVRHALGCLLARVAGRSTLEYLDADHRLRQERDVLEMIETQPESMDTLFDRWRSRLEAHRADH